MNNIEITKQAECLSVSGVTIISYQIGASKDGANYIGILSSSSDSKFSKIWTPLQELMRTLCRAGTSFASKVLEPLFAGKSAVFPAFTMAILDEEGYIEPVPGQTRMYRLTDKGREFA